MRRPVKDPSGWLSRVAATAGGASALEETWGPVASRDLEHIVRAEAGDSTRAERSQRRSRAGTALIEVGRLVHQHVRRAARQDAVPPTSGFTVESVDVLAPLLVARREVTAIAVDEWLQVDR